MEQTKLEYLYETEPDLMYYIEGLKKQIKELIEHNLAIENALSEAQDKLKEITT